MLSVLCYADDILALRRTDSLREEVALQEDIDRIANFISGRGMELNASKCKYLNVCLGSSPHKLQTPLSVAGEELEEVVQLRYLGVLLDQRLSFNAHWIGLASSTKRAMGALGRLVHRNPVALRHLYQERVIATMLHSLPYCPPSTQRAWQRLNGVSSYVAHTITNIWKIGERFVHGFEIMQMAGIDSASFLAIKHSLRFLFMCLWGKRRFGIWVEWDRGEGRRGGLRNLSERTGYEILVPASKLTSLEKLQPHRLLRLWNSLISLPDFKPELHLRSLNSFSAALPGLIEKLPADQRRLFGLEA